MSIKKINKNLPYRVILCHYNEIALKAAHYQKKILDILIESTKDILKRENLTLQSVLNLQGRIMYFFPTEEISKAIQVFRNIIGIQSISPAISCSRKYHILRRTFINFALQSLEDGETFDVKFKSIVPYPKKASEVRKDLYQIIRKKMALLDKKISVGKGKIQKKGKNGKIDKENHKSFTIEIRKKGTYIYFEDIPTIWSGFPIESKNTLLCPWSDSPHTKLAAQLLIRRGSIITPIIFTKEGFNNGKIPISMIKSIKSIAKFYSASIPVFLIPLGSIISYLESNEDFSKIRSSFNIKPFYFLICMRLLEILMFQTQKKTRYYYNERKLHYRGIISSLFVKDDYYLKIGQKFGGIQLTPLVSFTPDVIKTLISNFYSNTKINITNDEEIKSFNEEISHIWANSSNNSEKMHIRDQKNSDEHPHFLSQIFRDIENEGKQLPAMRDIEKFFQNQEIRNKLDDLIGKIIQEIQVINVSGKIL